MGQDGRYYAIAIWPQPEATDNVGAVWSYTSDYKVYNSDELGVLQADTSAVPLPASLENAASKVWSFVPSAGTNNGPLKNGGVFPIENGITTAIIYTVSDAAGNRVQCSLTVAIKPTHLSFYDLQASAVPQAPPDAADDWVESTVLAHYQAFVSAEACAEKCHSIAQTSAAAAAAEDADGSVRTCNAFLASRDGSFNPHTPSTNAMLLEPRRPFGNSRPLTVSVASSEHGVLENPTLFEWVSSTP